MRLWAASRSKALREFSHSDVLFDFIQRIGNGMGGDNPSLMIPVIAPGQVCYLGTIEGIVLEVLLKGDGYVTYRVAWWDGPNHKAEWFEPCEVSHGPTSTQIGFLKFGDKS